MAYLWFGVAALAALVVLLVIRRFFGARRTMRRVALPLAICERAVEDALGELALPDEEEALFVSAFEPIVLRVASIPEAELCALGKPAAELGARLCACVAAWNAAAGRVERRAALLPLLLEAHHLARELVRFLAKDSLEVARAAARDRVLVALVAPPAPPTDWVH